MRPCMLVSEIEPYRERIPSFRIGENLIYKSTTPVVFCHTVIIRHIAVDDP